MSSLGPANIFRRVAYTSARRATWMNALMDLKTDYAFNQLFGKPERVDILMALLNALLRPETGQGMVAIDIRSSEISPSSRSGKGKRLDIYVHTEGGERINLEIQVGRQRKMPKRTLLYWSGLYEAQAMAGMDCGQPKRTITINIVNFVMLPSTARYHTSYHVNEDEERFELTNALGIYLIELPRFRRSYRHDLGAAAKDRLGRWLLLLDAAKNMQIRKALEGIAMVDSAMDHALRVCEEISRDPEHYAEYLSRRKALLDELSQVRSAERRGLEKGLKEELDKGTRETRRQIARAMLTDGESVERVMKFAGLGVDEIAALPENES